MEGWHFDFRTRAFGEELFVDKDARISKWNTRNLNIHGQFILKRTYCYNHKYELTEIRYSYKFGINTIYSSDVLLTVHLSIFISVFNQLDAQNVFHNKFYFMPLHVSSICAHHKEVKLYYTASGIITPIGVELELIHVYRTVGIPTVRERMVVDPVNQYQKL